MASVGGALKRAENLSGRLADALGWMYITLLWVSDDLRGQGFGVKLMKAAEKEARRRGIKRAWVDTFSFQARSFYEKLGYEEFGTLDYPPLHKRHFMRKVLVRHNN